MSDLVKRLREFTVTGAGPTMLEIEAADKIEQLERELADKRDIHNEQARVVAELASQLAAEKALADALYHDASSVYGIQPETGAAYRKARGL